jgi:uncharacterized protein (DUF2147 family)
MNVIKRYLFILLITLSGNANAKEFNGDDILGFWLSESGGAVIEIYKEKKIYSGKLVWLKVKFTGEVKEPLDKENPDEKLQTRSLDGLKNLSGFRFNDDEWNGGTVYDPKSGKTYKSYMSLKNSDTLKLRGYVGVPLFGRTSEWKRQKLAIPDEYMKNLKKIRTH